VTTMDDHRGAAPLGYLLEAIVAAGLICPFFIYSGPGTARGPPPEPAEIAKLNPR